MLRNLFSLLVVLGAHHSVATTLETFSNGEVADADAINANFDEHVAQDLEKRFINSIRTGDANKFLRAVKKLKEQKTEKPRSVLD